MTAFAAVILAGGRGSRMGGVDKAALTYNGVSFADRLAGELRGHDEIFLSVDRAGRLDVAGCVPVADAVPGCGPLGGLVAALRACRAEALLAVAVDSPLFENGLGRYLEAFYSADCDAVVAVDRGGRRHPLCAVYGKSALPLLEERLAAGNYRLMDALAAIRVREAPLEHSAYSDGAVTNVNTPAEYAALRRGGPAVIAISGVKNSGKTTLLTRVIPHLVKAGFRVGAVKRDGHDFVPDVPGSDSFRLRESGAETVAVFSRARYMIQGGWDGGGLEELLPRFAACDVVLYEGGKHSDLPKIEVVRGGVSDSPVGRPETLLAVCSDLPLAAAGVPTVKLDDYAGVAERIAGYCREAANHA